MIKKCFIGMLATVTSFAAIVREPYQPQGQVHEWENPLRNRINAEAARTNAAVPLIGKNAVSLNGEWNFNWVKTPDLRPKDFYKTDFDVSKWKKIPVPSSWQIQGYGTPHYSNVDFIFKVDPPRVMGEPPRNWVTFDERNPVGSYRKDFDLPKNFNNKNVFVRFDGVDAGYYLWVNGKYVGYSEDSYTATEFNISDLVKPGKNIIAVEVYRFTDGSYLEDQDFFRHSGIFRDVTLYTLPNLAITDFFVRPTLTKDYKKGILVGDVTITNYGEKKSVATKVDLQILKEKISIEIPAINSMQSITVPFDFKKDFAIKSWNAEEPNLYDFSLKIGEQKIEMPIGFRTIEIGQNGEFLVNGRETLFKGVNVHESHPDMGRAITKEVIEKDIEIMKKNNVNILRCSHYPHHRYWYELADKIGMYVMDEANCEAHGTRGGQHDISRIPEFKQAHVERNMNMVNRTKNNPSVIFWSLGNESGNGPNFDAAATAIKSYDKTRYLHYCEYNHGNKNVDMDSTMYPPVSSVISWGEQKNNTRPFFICEYAHSMGNALGNFKEYQDAFEKYPRMVGGCIWDWVDQNIRAVRGADGKLKAAPYKGNTLGYGGQFGDAPTQGNFCDNGVITSDRQETPKTKEMKYVFQPVKIEKIENNNFKITNKYFHKTMKNVKIEIFDTEGNKNKAIETIKVPDLESKGSWKFEISAKLMNKNLLFTVIENKQNIGHEAFIKENNFKNTSKKQSTKDIKADLKNGKLEIETTQGKIVFNEKSELAEIFIDGKNVLKTSPNISIFRAPVDNDAWIRGTWWNMKMHEISATVAKPEISWKKIKNNAIQIVANYTTNGSAVQLKYRTVWTVFSNGEIHCENLIYPMTDETVVPRLGFNFTINPEFKNITYLGFGPWENYIDRMSSTYLGKHKLSVDEMMTMYSRPQSGGNRVGVEYMQFSNGKGNAITIMAENSAAPFEASANYWTELELDGAKTIERLPAKNKVVVNIDAFQCGLGGSSCGPRPMAEYITYNKPTALSFVISVGAKNMQDKFNVANAPIVLRDNNLMVSLKSATPNFPIKYSVNGGEAKDYKNPFKMENGEITAWSEGGDASTPKTSQKFDKQVTRAAWKIVSTSSEEPGEGFAAHAIDNKPNTCWHTQYKNALPNYPHNFVVDMGGKQDFTGFIYTPRPDEKNGLIGKYKFLVSDDGKKFTEVKSGKFSYHYIRKDPVSQRIEFGKKVSARYFKFEAIAPAYKEHPWANCAEISIIPAQ